MTCSPLLTDQLGDGAVQLMDKRRPFGQSDHRGGWILLTDLTIYQVSLLPFFAPFGISTADKNLSIYQVFRTRVFAFRQLFRQKGKPLSIADDLGFFFTDLALADVEFFGSGWWGYRAAFWGCFWRRGGWFGGFGGGDGGG